MKNVYTDILNAIDTKEVDEDEDIYAVKRRYFTSAYDEAIESQSNTWFVKEDQLHLSAIKLRYLCEKQT